MRWLEPATASTSLADRAPWSTNCWSTDGSSGELATRQGNSSSTTGPRNERAEASFPRRSNNALQSGYVREPRERGCHGLRQVTALNLRRRLVGHKVDAAVEPRPEHTWPAGAHRRGAGHGMDGGVRPRAPQLAKFDQPMVCGVDFPRLGIATASNDQERGELVVRTYAAEPAAAPPRAPTPFAAANRVGAKGGRVCPCCV